MIRLTVNYPNTPGGRFDLDYYLTKHMPLVDQKMKPHGLRSWSVVKGLGGVAPGSPAPFMITATMDFDSMETLQGGMAAESASILADIPNYTDIQPQIQIDEILKMKATPATA